MTGDDTRQDLVLLPGWSLPASVFDAGLSLLAPHWRVTCLDLPAAASLQDMASRLLDTAPPRATWCGFSLGGMVALQAAAQAPARVAAVLALAANVSFVARDGWPQAMPPATLAGFAAGLDTDIASTLARFDALQCRGSTQVRADLRRLRALRDATAVQGAAVLHGGLQALRDADLRTAVARIECPLAWHLGSDDALVPAAVAADIRACAPAADVTVVAEASHFFFLQQPAYIATALANLMSTGKSS